MNTEPPTDDDPNGPRGAAGPEGAPSAAETPEVPAADGAGAREPDGTPPSGARDEQDGTAPDASSARRRRGAVAAVVGAVLLVAGGGAYVAATASGGDGDAGPGGGGSAPPALALDGYGTGGRPGIAVGEPNPYGAVYRASGELPDGPDSAAVYRAEGRVSKDDVARLAKALRLTGTPRLVGDRWQVGVAKGEAEPLLRVDREAPGTWTFSAVQPGGDDCPRGRPCKPGGSGSTTGTTDPVGEAAAKKAAAPVLKAVGQDDAKLDASQVLGGARVVNAEPRVGGLPTSGWTTGLQIGSGGEVVGGSGKLVAPREGAEYPVIGAEKALELMNGATTSYGRKGIGGCASPVPLKDRDETPCAASPTGGARGTVRVEDAEFGLAARTSAGRPVLVPSWLFEVRPAGEETTSTVARAAVDPRYLTAPGTPGQPSPTGSSSAHDAHVTGYRADGTELTVVYEGGVCTTYGATAREDAKKVTVTVTGTTAHPERPCIAVARVYRATLHLDAPLGDRTVVGPDGRPVPKATTPLPSASPTAR